MGLASILAQHLLGNVDLTGEGVDIFGAICILDQALSNPVIFMVRQLLLIPRHGAVNLLQIRQLLRGQSSIVQLLHARCLLENGRLLVTCRLYLSLGILLLDELVDGLACEGSDSCIHLAVDGVNELGLSRPCGIALYGTRVATTLDTKGLLEHNSGRRCNQSWLGLWCKLPCGLVEGLHLILLQRDAASLRLVRSIDLFTIH